jgi:hypothetical protein
VRPAPALAASATSLALAACAPGPVSGGGAGGGAGAGNSGGAAAGCVALDVDLALLDPTIAWARGGPVWSGAWPDMTGRVSLAWAPGKPAQNVDGNSRVLVITELDLGAGAHLASHVYDPFPADPNNDGIFAAGKSPSGSFLVAYAYLVPGSPNDLSTIFYALGDTSVPESLTVLPEVLSQVHLPTDIVWDGEAFAVHGDGGVDEWELVVARVAPDGTVLTPSTVYGRTGASGFGPTGYDLSFDAVTGRTWAFNANLPGGLLSAHELDGAVVFAEPLEIDLVTGGSMSRGRIAAHAGGVDLVWFEYSGDYAYIAQRRGLDGALQAEAVLPYPIDHVGREHALLHEVDGRVFMVNAHWEGAELTVLDLEAGTFTEPEPLLLGDGTGATDLRELRLWDDPSGRWLAFKDIRGSAEHPGHPGPAWRVVRVAPGCVYKTWSRMVQDGEAP